jgi:predicted PurR-regulated permease PerM
LVKKEYENKFHYLAFIVIVFILGYLTYQVIKPFLVSVAWAIVFTMLFYPLYAFLLRHIKLRTASSLVTMAVMLVIILGPVSYLFYLLVDEVQFLADYVIQPDFDPVSSLLYNPILGKFFYRFLSLVNMTAAEFQKAIIDTVSHVDKEFVGRLTKGLGNMAGFGLDFMLMMLATFFLLKDGPLFLLKLRNYLPFSTEQKDRLMKDVKNIVISTIYGGVTVAIVQAIIGGFAFLFLGVPSPVLWGMAMFIASFIPIVGTLVVWGPAAIYLVVQGMLMKGIVLLFIGIFGISMADNIIRPLIVRGRTRMPTLVIFFSILGGLKFFGLIGFILGPLCVALFVSVLEIFRSTEDFKASPEP